MAVFQDPSGAFISAWEPRIVRTASLGVAAFGLVWLVERLVSS